MLESLFFLEVEEEHSFLHSGIQEVCYKIVFMELYDFGMTYFAHLFLWIASKLEVYSLQVVVVWRLFVMEYLDVLEFFDLLQWLAVDIPLLVVIIIFDAGMMVGVV